MVDRWLLAVSVFIVLVTPAKSHLIVNNYSLNKGKLDPKNNPSMIIIVPAGVAPEEQFSGVPEAPCVICILQRHRAEASSY